MNKTIQKRQPTKSKKAVEPQWLSAGILTTEAKRTNFQMVVAGVCLHDNASLLAPVKTKGVGMKAVCSKCGHTWYFNKKIKTCGCLTCRGAKRKSMELAGTNRVGRNSALKDGGPLWSRTTDLSLIRIGDRANISDYINEWYSEQKLKGLVETTIYNYRQKVEALLGEYARPAEIDIKRYLAKKQEFGACSGTIANYVKAYRSFFGYLYERDACPAMKTWQSF